MTGSRPATNAPALDTDRGDMPFLGGTLEPKEGHSHMGFRYPATTPLARWQLARGHAMGEQNSRGKGLRSRS
jgi:hypothetical protein